MELLRPADIVVAIVHSGESAPDFGDLSEGQRVLWAKEPALVLEAVAGELVEVPFPEPSAYDPETEVQPPPPTRLIRCGDRYWLDDGATLQSLL